jgi:asparaginyl-tRNA synthetase
MTDFMTVKEAMKQGSGEVQVRGWIYRERKSNAFAFLVVRDGTDIIQCIVKKDNVSEEMWEEAEQLLVESAIEVTGTIKEDKRAPSGYEIEVQDLNVIHQAERYPITKDQSTEFLLDKRHLWVRSRQLTSVWKVKAQVLKAIRDFFDSRDYLEVTPPIITGSSCEGGSTLFHVDYFGEEEVFLSQSAQLYLEAMIFSYPKVWALTPSFRAEPSKTTRHLTEYWHLEAEAAFMDFEALLKFEEDLISHICQHVAKHCVEDLKILGRDPADLEKIKAPFPRITYDDALKLLEENGMKVEWGKDLRTLEENELMKHYDKPLIVTKYPKQVKAFYMKDDPEDDRVVLCCDVLAPEGYGEIVGSSERETDVNVLIDKLQKQGEKVEHYDWYLDLRRFGSVQHSGFGLGTERIVAWLCKLETVRDAIPFPRTIKRSTP